MSSEHEPVTQELWEAAAGNAVFPLTGLILHTLMVLKSLGNGCTKQHNERLALKNSIILFIQYNFERSLDEHVSAHKLDNTHRNSRNIHRRTLPPSCIQDSVLSVRHRCGAANEWRSLSLQGSCIWSAGSEQPPENSVHSVKHLCLLSNMPLNSSAIVIADCTHLGMYSAVPHHSINREQSRAFNR